MGDRCVTADMLLLDKLFEFREIEQLIGRD